MTRVVWSSGFRVLGFRVRFSGFRVSGLAFRLHDKHFGGLRNTGNAWLEAFSSLSPLHMKYP